MRSLCKKAQQSWSDYSRRPLAEAMLRIDLGALRRQALVTASNIAKVSYARGDGTQVEATVSFAEVPAWFGGRRVWFRCPCCNGLWRPLRQLAHRLSAVP
jgi:hypothetical protein